MSNLGRGVKPSIDGDLVSLAYQLRSLHNYDSDLYLKHVTPKIRAVIVSVVTNYSAPQNVPRGTQPFVRRSTRSRSTPGVSEVANTSSVASSPPDPVTFPQSWTKNTGKTGTLAKTLTQFRRGIGDYLTSEYHQHWAEQEVGRHRQSLSPIVTPSIAFEDHVEVLPLIESSNAPEAPFEKTEATENSEPGLSTSRQEESSYQVTPRSGSLVTPTQFFSSPSASSEDVVRTSPLRTRSVSEPLSEKRALGEFTPPVNILTPTDRQSTKSSTSSSSEVTPRYQPPRQVRIGEVTDQLWNFDEARRLNPNKKPITFARTKMSSYGQSGPSNLGPTPPQLGATNGNAGRNFSNTFGQSSDLGAQPNSRQGTQGSQVNQGRHPDPVNTT